MRIGDTVAIRVGRSRRVVFGELVECGAGLGVVRIPSGRHFLRDLQYVKPSEVGWKELHAQRERDKRRKRP